MINSYSIRSRLRTSKPVDDRLDFSECLLSCLSLDLLRIDHHVDAIALVSEHTFLVFEILKDVRYGERTDITANTLRDKTWPFFDLRRCLSHERMSRMKSEYRQGPPEILDEPPSLPLHQ